MPVIPGGKPPILTDNTTMTTASNQSMIPAIRYIFFILHLSYQKIPQRQT